MRLVPMFCQALRGRLMSTGGMVRGRAKRGDGVIAAHETEQGIEGVLVEFLSGVTGVHGGDARRDAFLVGVQFRREIVRAWRFKADFEPLVQVQDLVELHQLRLEDGALGGIQGFDAVGPAFRFRPSCGRIWLKE